MISEFDATIEVLDGAFALEDGGRLYQAIINIIEAEEQSKSAVLTKPKPENEELQRANGAVVALGACKTIFADIYEKAKKKG